MKAKKQTQIQRIRRLENLLVQVLMKITELNNKITEIEIRENEKQTND
ncbi:hypothetical protein [uncultured Polaribacter sp.]|nr:hypothetical protein [uncultured Polaribacter sp.]